MKRGTRRAYLICPDLAVFVIAASTRPPAGVRPLRTRPCPFWVWRPRPKRLALTKGLAVGLIGQYGRLAVPSDLLAWQMASGAMAAPREGLVIGKNAKGEDQAWAAVEANKEGWIENRALAGGYLYMVVESARPRTMILDATGFYVAWINGEPRGGEKYGADYLRHPVRLVEGPQRAPLPGRARPVQGTALRAAGRGVLHRQGHDAAGPRRRGGRSGLGGTAAGQRDGREAGGDRGRLSLWRAGEKRASGYGRRASPDSEAGRAAGDRRARRRGPGQGRGQGQGAGRTADGRNSGRSRSSSRPRRPPRITRGRS